MRRFKPSWYSTIQSAIKLAIADSASADDELQFDFNGVNVVVCAVSDPELIYRDWNRGMMGYLGDNPTIGPFPKEKLSADEIASDAGIQSESDRESAKRQAEYEKTKAAKIAALKELLCVTGPIELADEKTWNDCKEKNSDPYGGRCVRFAEEWARLMQMRIAKGETVSECADELSSLADDDGITGFMYGASVAMLAKCWKHGDDLRRWHNKETQIGTEGDDANESGGVLNPAVLKIKT